MRLSSLLKRRQKIRVNRPLPPEEEPRISRGAIKRALRHAAASSNYSSAARLGERIATALSTIETAVLAIDAVNDHLREASGLLFEAARTDNMGRRALLAGRYDDVRSEIDATVGAATHNRVNLINGRLIGGQAAAFEVALDDEGRAGIAIGIVNLTTGARGLALSPPRTAFEKQEEIDLILGEIELARTRIAEVSLRFSDHAALIAARLTRLQKLAGKTRIESIVPTGADAEEPTGTTEDLRRPLDLRFAEQQAEATQAEAIPAPYAEEPDEDSAQ
tara:strand:- start:4827 stop:5657 length:831 start_codon:yes stop_codon:yes gene_type:complete